MEIHHFSDAKDGLLTKSDFLMRYVTLETVKFWVLGKNCKI